MANLTPALVTSLIEGLKVDFPEWEPGTRPAHSKGIAAIGSFRGVPDAGRYCKAEQFNSDWTPVTMRFSNANGQLDPDWTPQVRGLAVKFHLGETSCDHPDGRHSVEHTSCANLQGEQEADLVCMTTPMFMAKTPEAALEFERAYEPKKVPRGLRRKIQWLKSWLSLCPLPPDPETPKSGDFGVLEWAQHNPEGQAFIVANGLLNWVWDPKRQKLVRPGTPESYARTAFHAVHAFGVEGCACTGKIHAIGKVCPNPIHRMVRLSVEPAEGVRNQSRAVLDELYPGKSHDYLSVELANRLSRFYSRFNLWIQIADPWDDTTDPTTVWPSNRKRILMGTLELDRLIDEGAGEKLSFNPLQLAAGMSPSDDPILEARRHVYQESQRQRGADPCPFMGALTRG